METIDYGGLIQRPYIIYVYMYIDPIQRYIYKRFCKTKSMKKTNLIAKRRNLIAKTTNFIAKTMN